MSKAQRNAKCACGSDKKYKHCHGAPGRPAQPLNRALTAVVVAVGASICLLGAWALFNPDQTAADGRVWSAEHNHWHDAAGRELGAGAGGPAPVEGAVWSAEHNHWHDASGQELSVGAGPDGPAPPGKVWSDEHNHWH